LQPQPFENLGEHLLRAGVAHRHVRRYVRELHDHYEDLLREELSKGVDRSEAERAAYARLGNEEELARSVLAQPALRSTAARHPILVFGAAPFVAWLTWLALSLFAFGVWAESYRQPGLRTLELGYALLLFNARVLPVALGILLLVASIRQRMTSHWPMIGTAIVALFAGTLGVNITLADTAQASSVGMNSSLLPLLFPSSPALGQPNFLSFAIGLARAALMLAMAATPYVIWRMRHSHRTMVS
jgi:general stress protein CsbA